MRGKRIILTIALAVLAAAGTAVADERSEGKGRLAPDLVASLAKHSASDVVRLVINLKGSDSSDVADRVTELGGVVRGNYSKVRQMVVDLPAEAVTRLVDAEGLDYVAPDRPVDGLASHLQTTTGSSQVYNTTGSPDWGYSLTGSWSSGFDGSGVTVAVLDSGIEPDMNDLKSGGGRRVILSLDFTGQGVTGDPFGHGTHVAGIVAGNGDASLRAGFNFAGVAPGANLVNFRVLDGSGHGFLSNVIAAIDQAVSSSAYYHIRVVNLSLAAPPVESYRDDPLCHAVDRAALAGLVVVAAGGNFGLDQYGNRVYGGITSPGLCPSALTVGAVNTRQTDARSDDLVAKYSSSGPTRSRSIDPVTGAVVYDNLAKPDLVAPGVRVVSLESPNNALVTAHPELHVDTGNVNPRCRYMMLSGTSMSAAVVSGTAALMKQANPSLTPNQVKALLMYAAQIMDGPDLFQQGAGLLNAEGAVRAAASLRSRAGSLLPGQRLVTMGLPRPRTTIAAETFPWSRSLIWNTGLLSGDALVAIQQAAYAQSLIWGVRDLSVWGSGVTWSDGLYNDDYVAYGQAGQWANVVWDQGSTLPSGLLYRSEISASGAYWINAEMTDAFFTLDPSSLIWGYSRYGYDLSLIWGFSGFDSSLIWGAY
jgi:serine protease AprX